MTSADLWRGLCAGSLILLLMLSGCAEDAPPTVPLAEGTIDTFEDGDINNAFGHPWEGIAEGNGPQATAYVAPGGFSGSSFHLVLDGQRPAGASGAEVAGVRASLLQERPPADPDRQTLARDVSGRTGLAFMLKGTPGSYIVQLGSTRITDFDYYNTYIEVTPAWNEFRIPFAQFRQEGFGQPMPWTGKDLSHVAFYANLTGSFALEIDDVRFY